MGQSRAMNRCSRVALARVFSLSSTLIYFYERLTSYCAVPSAHSAPNSASQQPLRFTTELSETFVGHANGTYRMHPAAARLKHHITAVKAAQPTGEVVASLHVAVIFICGVCLLPCSWHSAEPGSRYATLALEATDLARDGPILKTD